jgi:hypothetical protein
MCGYDGGLINQIENGFNLTVFSILFSFVSSQARSHHDRLIRQSGASQASKDNPLKLHSTTAWASEGV